MVQRKKRFEQGKNRFEQRKKCFENRKWRNDLHVCDHRPKAHAQPWSFRQASVRSAWLLRQHPQKSVALSYELTKKGDPIFLIHRYSPFSIFPFSFYGGCFSFSPSSAPFDATIQASGGTSRKSSPTSR